MFKLHLFLMGFICILAKINFTFAQPVLAWDQFKQDYLRPNTIPFPEDNPYSDAKAELGKILFFEPRISASGTQSCATCHNPSFDWEDSMATGTGHGHKKLGRASMTVLNLAWDAAFFWDGRAETLEEQALGPIESAKEMNMDLDTMLSVLQNISGYPPLFAKAFPDNPQITEENVAKALATFQRTIISSEAPFDRWINGEEDAISLSAKRGFELFNGKANCAACHSGWAFSDSSFHDIGLADDDLGRGELIPHVVPMQHAFKTVGLRNIAQRSPYMHDGSLTTLEGVIDHYDKGFVQRESLSDEMRPLKLESEEKNDLVSFLKSLTSQDPLTILPSLPR